MICVYHNRDLDGFASGAIMKRKFPNAIMRGYDYGEPFEMDIPSDEIMMADVSLPMSTMRKIAALCNGKFTWIDHHISAITDYNKMNGDAPGFLKAVLDSSISACEGTWRYLFPNEEIPRAIKLLGEYDTWKNHDKFHWEDVVLPFQFGMRMICNSAESFPDNVFWDNTFVPLVVEKGKTILKYQAQVSELQCRKASFEHNFEGLRAICLNGGGFNSDMFKSVYDESKHDIMMPFQFDGTKWTISLYTTKEIDCSEVAKKHGGGGHKKASGFQVNCIDEIFPAIKSHMGFDWMKKWIDAYDKSKHNCQTTGLADAMISWMEKQPMTNS